MQQGSSEWLAWRRQGIGGSEMPAVMGLCPYKTAYEIWKLKTGRASDEQAGWAAQRGNRFEAAARARYELIESRDMPAALVEHHRYSFIRASLDGLCGDGSTILEIKIPGAKVFGLARDGVVAENYAIQCEYQLLASGATENHFFCCRVDGKGASERIVEDALVRYRTDDALRRRILASVFAFWGLVISDTPPPLSSRDAKDLSDDESAREVFKKLGEAKRELDRIKDAETNPRGALARAKKDFEVCRDEALKFVDHPRIHCCGVELVRVARQVQGRASVFFDVRLK